LSNAQCTHFQIRRVSGDEQNRKPLYLASEEDAKARLLEKLAVFAEIALDRVGKRLHPDLLPQSSSEMIVREFSED